MANVNDASYNTGVYVDAGGVFNVDNTDAKFWGTSSSYYTIWDASANELIFTATKMSFAGALGTADHLIDFTGVTVPISKNLIRGGSYGSPMTYTAASMGQLQLYYGQSRDTGVDVNTFFYGLTTGQAGALGCTALVESGATTPGPKTLEGGQFMAGLRANAYLATASGDATAGMYGCWLKVYAATTSVASSGCKVAAVWLDNQMNCTVSGEEYAAYITTGGSVPDAVFGFETSSSGWAAFAYFDETCYNVAPVSTKSCTSQTYPSDVSVIWNLNGTAYYMPLYTVDHTT